MKNILLALVVTCFVAVGCKNETKETKKQTEVTAENIKETSFKVSGMTCEVGCAKSIASKLSKLDGVVEANVVFADSVAKVKFDKTKTDADKLMKYVDGMSNSMYKTSYVRPENCKCEGCKGKTTCSETCKNECNVAAKEKKVSDKKPCEKECCKEKVASGSSCDKPCCATKKEKTACATDCKKACCEKA